jgi:ribosomal protein S18 acetylase RimI-like enzyme
MVDIIRLCRQREGHLHEGHGLTIPQRIEIRARLYHAATDRLGTVAETPVLLAERDGRVGGYMALVLGQKESITDEQQVTIFDFSAPGADGPEVLAALLRVADAMAQERGEQYFVVNIPPHATTEEAWFQQAGFSPDLVRIDRPVSTDPPPGMREDGYRTRPSDPTDLLFILYLNTLAAPFTIPPNRTRDEHFVGQRYLQIYSEMDYRPSNPKFKVLIAEKIKPVISAGFIMLQLGWRDEMTLEPVGYLYDIAVHPDHMGQHLALLLVHEGQKLLSTLGTRWLIADISATNPRPLKLALSYLGFSVMYRRWARAVPAVKPRS